MYELISQLLISSIRILFFITTEPTLKLDTPLPFIFYVILMIADKCKEAQLLRFIYTALKILQPIVIYLVLVFILLFILSKL